MWAGFQKKCKHEDLIVLVHIIVDEKRHCLRRDRICKDCGTVLRSSWVEPKEIQQSLPGIQRGDREIGIEEQF